MKTLLYWLLIFAGMWALTSCASSASKVRRAKRLLESSGASWKTDTVFTDVIVKVPETRIDSVMRQVNFTDTITVMKDKVVTKVKVNTVEHTVYVSTKCPEKIVTKRVPVIVNKEIKVGDSFWRRLGRSALWFLIGLIAGWIVRSLLAMVR